MANDCMITTIDNPYDPFEQFTSWRLFDIEKEYYTCEHLARLLKPLDGLSEKEINDEIDRAMDVMIDTDILNIYKKVYSNASKTQD